MKSIYSVLFVVTALFVCVQSVHASSSYVLPYPDVMPGNKLYKVSQVAAILKKYTSFGNFSQFKYYLEQADKDLVEAKTLFEYTQYPLALKALDRSDKNFQKAYPYLVNAERQGVNIQEKQALFVSAQEKHREVLEKLIQELPESFVWRDEKKSPVFLNIGKKIKKSITIRNSQ